MKRIYYVSRFSEGVDARALEDIARSSHENNRPREITGFLVCLGDTFFQVLEGPEDAVNSLFFEKIARDPRHDQVLCLRTESAVQERLFPDWHMKVFDLNRQGETLPFAFRQMLTALVESHYVIAQYTQPSVFRMLAAGVNPTTIAPRKKEATVLSCDIIGFSIFSQGLDPGQLVDLVNTHIELCSEAVDQHGGEVTKIIGDGVLAYFSGSSADPAVAASLELSEKMSRQRRDAPEGSPFRYLHSGIGLAHGPVYEGNIGAALKKDFTILGKTVNLASRLQSYTRDLEVRILMDRPTKECAGNGWEFVPMGRHRLKGHSRALELFGVSGLDELDVQEINRTIERRFAHPRRGRSRAARP